MVGSSERCSTPLMLFDFDQRIPSGFTRKLDSTKSTQVEAWLEGLGEIHVLLCL